MSMCKCVVRVFLVSTISLFLIPVGFADEDDKDNARLTGSWFGSLHADGLPEFKVLVELSSDGRISTSDSSDFLGKFQTPTKGTWRRTDKVQIEFTLLAINTDLAGNYIGVTRTLGKGKLGDDKKALRGTFTTESLAPDQDPLDPNAVPFDIIDAIFVIRKIPVLSVAN